jgi:hypothetical protein
MIWLVRLYPKRWRNRYGAELQQLIRDLQPAGSHLTLAFDLVKGALSAHLQQGIAMNKVQRQVTTRVAVIVGVVWLCLFVEILLSNVVFPSKTDDDAIPVVLSYLGVFTALFVTGLLAARAGASRRGQVVAGLIAGTMIGLLTAASFAIVDNVWLDIVAQQQTKIDGFAHSNATSMRNFINEGLIGVTVFLTIGFGAIGAILGLAGGLAADAETNPPRNIRSSS